VSLISELARIPLPGALANLSVSLDMSIAPWSQTAKLPPFPTSKILLDSAKDCDSSLHGSDCVTLLKTLPTRSSPEIKDIKIEIVILAYLSRFRRQGEQVQIGLESVGSVGASQFRETLIKPRSFLQGDLSLTHGTAARHDSASLPL